MTNFWKFFLDRHHFTTFLMVVLFLAGTYAVSAIPKESTPDIAIPLGVVITALPGASASDVEQLVTDKIEDVVLGVENVSKVTSSSGAGVSSVSVEFNASANIDKSIQLLKEAVDKAKPELPQEATDPIVSDVNFADQPILIVAISGNLAPAELTALGETAANEIERVPGVSSVALSGVREREVQVIVRQAKLQEYGLPLSAVTNAVAQAGVGTPTGSITVDGVSYAVRFEAGISRPEDVASVALVGPGGIPLHISDVAEVVDGLEDPSSFSRVSAHGNPADPSLTLTVSKSRGGNIVATASSVKEKLSELQKPEGALAGTTFVISYDGAKEVGDSLTELTRAGIETVVLVVIVLLLTLGWREALVAAASIPLSFLIAFIGLLFAGNTLNNVSLFSLILAIGILVDSGVVVVEAFHTRLRTLGNAHLAAVSAIREYAWPLIAGTFTTIVVFIPLFFLSGIMGKFLASIPFTVIFVLIASIFVALGFVPLLSVMFVKSGHSKAEARQERLNHHLQTWYRGFLARLLDNRKGQKRFVWLMAGLFVVALALPMTGVLKSILFPGADSDFVYLEIERPQGTALEETDIVVREVEEVLYTMEGVESFVTVVGSGSSFSGSLDGSSASGANIANITINLPEGNKETSAEFVARLRKEMRTITSAVITVGEPANGPPSSAPLSITFVGDDLTELSLTADRAAQVLSQIPGVINIDASTKTASAEFVVALDGARSAEAGVSALSVADTLRTALFSAKATSIRTGGNDVEVRVKLDVNTAYTTPSETTHATIDAVRSLAITGTRGTVPLSTVASVTYEPAQTSIRHEAGDRITSVTAEVAPGTNAIEANAEFSKRFTSDLLGTGVVMSTGGASEDVAKSFTELFLALIAGAALMLSILVLEFNSFRQAFYLLLLIPLSLIGVHGGLALMGQPLSLTSMLGVIALAGVIINHAIILMDSIARIHKERPELPLREVVIEAAASRLRPIVLTTIVTCVGMVPLTLASPFWAPLAFAIMFGLAFSLLLTLVLIPILYYRWPGSAIRKKYSIPQEPLTSLHS